MNAEDRGKLEAIKDLPRDFLSLEWDKRIAWLIAQLEGEAEEVLRLSVLATDYADERMEAERRAVALEAEWASLCDAINIEARECGSPEAEQPTMHRMKNAIRLIVDKLRSERNLLEAEVARQREALEGSHYELVKMQPFQISLRKAATIIEAALAPQAGQEEEA